ncbi:hypothetical protein Cgig2_000989 [Carnegiea gigantea]|uniref:Uncharacterized protein n=1 Tax=Carnegiea gigantea TaxID=171969 RepID=A0A9Q1JKQ0_9CARY|nr:hypothetical protein Cgig2_000989 [Carnegiea gigantea]
MLQDPMQHEADLNPQMASLYASMVDSDEGASLKYIPAIVVNGAKLAKITKEDVTPKKSSVLYMTLGVSPPAEVIEGFVRRIWKSYDPDKVVLGPDSLSKLGSIIGITIKTDKYTKENSMIQYVRLLIDIPLNGAFPIYIEFVNDMDVVVRKHKQKRMESRVVDKGIPNEPQQQPRQPTPNEGFNIVPSKHLARLHTRTYSEEMQTPQSHTAIKSKTFLHYIGTWLKHSDHEAILMGLSKKAGYGSNGYCLVCPYHEKDFATCLENCELSEMRTMVPYYTWTNKSVWTRLNRVTFDYTHTSYKSNALSNYTSLIISFPNNHKPKATFQYCNIWSRHLHFPGYRQSKGKNQVLKHQEEECRNHYIKVLSSMLSLIKQQSKPDWIKYGDECTRYFFTRVKQRKLATYIYTLQDQSGHAAE